MRQVVGLPNNSYNLSPIRRGFAPGFVHYKKGCTRLAAASDKVCQLLAHGRWFSPGTLASSTTKTGRHDIAKILLKVALSTIKSIKSNNVIYKPFEVVEIYTSDALSSFFSLYMYMSFLCPNIPVIGTQIVWLYLYVQELHVCMLHRMKITKIFF